MYGTSIQHICGEKLTDGKGNQHGVTRTTRSRTEEQRQQDLERISRYRDIDSQVRAHVRFVVFSPRLRPQTSKLTARRHQTASGRAYTPEVFQLATKLLRLNPEYYTIWNVRRRLLISGLLSKPSSGSSPSKASPSSSRTATTTTSSADSSCSSSTATQPNPESQTTGRSGTTADTTGEEDGSTPTENETDARARDQQNDLEVLRSELNFTVPLLMEFPKCYWIWDHRSWLLQKAIERLDPAVARRIWEEELGLDTKMLTKDRRNFHAWGYRRIIIKHLESEVLNGKSMVESEFEFTTKMIHVDLSNFSAWHNRSQLIPRLLDERNADDNARRGFFDNGKLASPLRRS